MTEPINFNTLLTLLKESSFGNFTPISLGQISIYGISDSQGNYGILHVESDHIVSRYVQGLESIDFDRGRVIKAEHLGRHTKVLSEYLDNTYLSEDFIISKARSVGLKIYVLTKTHIDNLLRTGSFFGTNGRFPSVSYMMDPGYWKQKWSKATTSNCYIRDTGKGSLISIRKIPDNKISISRATWRADIRVLEWSSPEHYLLPENDWVNIDPVTFDLSLLDDTYGQVAVLDIDGVDVSPYPSKAEEEVVGVKKDHRNEIAGIPYVSVVHQVVVVRGDQILEAVAGVRGDGLVDIYLTKNKQLFAIVSQSLMREYLNKAIEYVS